MLMLIQMAKLTSWSLKLDLYARDQYLQALTEGGQKYQSTEDDRFCLYETNILILFISCETAPNIIILLTSARIHFSRVFKTCNIPEINTNAKLRNNNSNK